MEYKNITLDLVGVTLNDALRMVMQATDLSYFIDGETFFGDIDRYRCMIDGTHPNDLGFARMAEVIEPIIKDILFK